MVGCVEETGGADARTNAVLRLPPATRACACAVREFVLGGGGREQLFARGNGACLRASRLLPKAVRATHRVLARLTERNKGYGPRACGAHGGVLEGVVDAAGDAWNGDGALAAGRCTNGVLKFLRRTTR